MTFIARYIHRRGLDPDYWRTIHADTLNEASKEAERYTRKGFIMVGLTQKEGAD